MPERFALIIPALNEEAVIGQTLDSLRGAPIAQLIVVDNGSTDGTAEAARVHGAEIVTEPHRGYGQACLAGIAALRADITVVCFMDGDGSDDPALAWNLWWAGYSLLDLHASPLFTDFMFYPIGINLAYFTITLLNGLAERAMDSNVDLSLMKPESSEPGKMTLQASTGIPAAFIRGRNSSSYSA